MDRPTELPGERSRCSLSPRSSTAASTRCCWTCPTNRTSRCCARTGKSHAGDEARKLLTSSSKYELAKCLPRCSRRPEAEKARGSCPHAYRIRQQESLLAGCNKRLHLVEGLARVRGIGTVGIGADKSLQLDHGSLVRLQPE